MMSQFGSLTRHEGHGTECLLDCYLGDGGEVKMGVVGHHNTTEQYRHYTCNENRFAVYKSQLQVQRLQYSFAHIVRAQ